MSQPNPYELLEEFEIKHGDYYTLLDNWAEAKHHRRITERREVDRLMALIKRHLELTLQCAGLAVQPKASAPSMAALSKHERFEAGFEIKHCGYPAQLLGNYSKREEGAKLTALGYVCAKCRMRFTVTDDLPRPTARMLDEVR